MQSHATNWLIDAGSTAMASAVLCIESIVVGCCDYATAANTLECLALFTYAYATLTTRAYRDRDILPSIAPSC
jgi:hypothetical protein